MLIWADRVTANVAEVSDVNMALGLLFKLARGCIKGKKPFKVLQPLASKYFFHQKNVICHSNFVNVMKWIEIYRWYPCINVRKLLQIADDGYNGINTVIQVEMKLKEKRLYQLVHWWLDHTPLHICIVL